MPYATGSGVQIHYQVEGSGAPLMFHTGFAGSLIDFYDAGYVDALKGENTLVLFDPRGQGESDKPHQTAAYSPDQRVADVLAVMDALDIRQADYLGYSMGAQVGFSLGAQVPQRFLSLMLGGASPFGNAPILAWAELLHQGMAAFLAENERLQGPQPADRRARWLAMDAESLAAATLVERPSLESVLGTMNLPILLWCGDQDTSHERVRRAAALLPNASFVSLPGLNHRQAGLDSAATLPHITAFLQRVRAGAGAPTVSA